MTKEIKEKCRLNNCERNSCSLKHQLCKSHLTFYYRNGYVVDKQLRGYTSHDEVIVYKE